mmetsp:Transcript_89527/g.256395  ORF Transcript_89527/g.256395 Transcript_89527/m.256395 type:complete len:240 (-) Transcript_89527:385-1104(-)
MSCCSIIAPSWRFTSLPSLPNKMTVGSAPTRSREAHCGSLSESILATRHLGPNFLAAASRCGAIIWQGPHQVAYTSKSRGVELSLSSSSSSAPVSMTTAPGTMRPDLQKLAFATSSLRNTPRSRSTNSSFSNASAHGTPRVPSSVLNSLTFIARHLSRSSMRKRPSSPLGAAAAAPAVADADADGSTDGASWTASVGAPLISPSLSCTSRSTNPSLSKTSAVPTPAAFNSRLISATRID